VTCVERIKKGDGGTTVYFGYGRAYVPTLQTNDQHTMTEIPRFPPLFGQGIPLLPFFGQEDADLPTYRPT
jgi:hypothetical protein